MSTRSRSKSKRSSKRPRKSSSSKKRAAKSRSRRAAKDRSLNVRTFGRMGIELKYFDSYVNPTTVVTVPGSYGNGIYNPDPNVQGTNNSFAMAEGSGPSDRIGKQICIKSLQIRGGVDSLTSAITGPFPPPSMIVHVAVVLDRQTNGAACTAPDIFKVFSPNFPGAAFPMRNLNYGKRFKILKSETFSHSLTQYRLVPATTTYSPAHQIYTFDWFIPMDLIVNYTENDGPDIANIIDHSVHVFVVTNYENQAVVGYNARIRYLG